MDSSSRPPRSNDININTSMPAEDSQSSSSPTTHLTPDSDSDGLESNLELGRSRGESYKLQSRRMEDGEKFESPEEYDSEEDSGDEDGEERYGRRRASISTVQSYQLYTPDEERAVVRKFDRKLVLFVALLYLLSFLDRSNIGNARIAGLTTDLSLTSNQYEWLLTAFYITYILFEPMSLLFQILPAHIYITTLVLSWGIVASLQSISTSFTSLLILRILLGIGEAGFTGIPFYLSFFFKRSELALRTGLFISAAPLATSFASTLAFLIVKLGQYIPIASWRLLFLLEGFPSVVVAIIAYHTIPDSPSTAHYLTRREKRIARLRLRNNTSATEPKKHTKGVKIQEILATIKDPKSYLTAFMFFFTNMAFSSLPVFLPTIIQEMGHSIIVSQALCAPPYLLSFFVVIFTAYLSDRLQSRSMFIIFHALLSAAGYVFIAVAGARGWGIWWRYAGIYPACVGFFSVVTIVITWTINNQESESKQGTGFAMLQLIGQCGPLVGTRLYPERDAPLYLTGMSVCAGAMVFVAVLALVLRGYLKRKNVRVEGIEYAEIGEGETLVGKARRSTKFQYML